MSVVVVINSARSWLADARSEADVLQALRKVEALRLDVERKDAVDLVGEAFRAIGANPQWSTAPLVVHRLFESLVRRPRILDAYRRGDAIAVIEDRFQISRTALYALLGDADVERCRQRPGRTPAVDRAVVRLAAFLGESSSAIAAALGCSVRTIQRILAEPVVVYQPWVDAVATAEDGEELRGAWNRYLDELARYGAAVTGLTEPSWPSGRDRRALIAAGLAYRITEHDESLPEWLNTPSLVAEVTTSPVPQYIEIAKPLTPPIVARFNVALDEESFHSV